MVTELKQTIYLLPKTLALSTLASNTGAANIAAPNQYQVSGSNPWTLSASGNNNAAGTLYQIQNYIITQTDIATFINNRAGTSLLPTDILDFRNGNDATYFEIETT